MALEGQKLWIIFVVAARGTIGSFRLDYEDEFEYEYDFLISNQWRFQSPRSSCWF